MPTVRTSGIDTYYERRGAGHAANLDDPTFVTDALRTFLADVDGFGGGDAGDPAGGEQEV